MNLESIIVKINKYTVKRIQELSIAVTSGGIDNMEKYNYIIGQINAYEAVKQELSNLLEDKELYDTKGTVVDINKRNP
jgi:hypothetical protein|tara:strand:- start:1249 stop:1482 length:234 start_codon:yes stop_codon:yes gene_type:complete